jgi:hypothetical protein
MNHVFRPLVELSFVVVDFRGSVPSKELMLSPTVVPPVELR